MPLFKDWVSWRLNQGLFTAQLLHARNWIGRDKVKSMQGESVRQGSTAQGEGSGTEGEVRAAAGWGSFGTKDVHQELGADENIE